jgi:hypothetical protein
MLKRISNTFYTVGFYTVDFYTVKIYTIIFYTAIFYTVAKFIRSFFIRSKFIWCGGAGDTPQFSGKSTSGGGSSCTIYSDARQSEATSAAAQPITTSARRGMSI